MRNTPIRDSILNTDCALTLVLVFSLAFLNRDSVKVLSLLKLKLLSLLWMCFFVGEDHILFNWWYIFINCPLTLTQCDYRSLPRLIEDILFIFKIMTKNKSICYTNIINEISNPITRSDVREKIFLSDKKLLQLNWIIIILTTFLNQF